MVAIETELRQVVEAATGRLLELSDAAAAVERAKGKWSPKQVIGHLIDSASNNHQRFVRAQFTQDLVFPGYEQDDWVAVQRYQSAPWQELVALWRHFNLHLARVIEAIPVPVRQSLRRRHNLHELAWHTVPQEQPTTLEYFLRDYVGHLRHHLAQVLGPQ
ncbi:MAG TPA: DinB family protein [Planctomycetota bacterium]